ncbi:GIY-YIG nuclease family protein [Paenibacillus sp. N3/727]|uniref:GIY-YIG nuclease family protein n=1 Tax=Paenibacillus sp. N3/727 TaxID=2925845 RepID=UPI001F53DBC1|nr:GIY-YIG nuclease family protein [Paenibacillus sp. N3/727]UNK21040.1 GIY-YIG nuclease family protein [Paenibacillus sp. N3/727]
MENNPLINIDPTGFAPVLIGYIYIIEGPYNGKNETYIGSTAQDIKKRMGNHKWKQMVKHPDSTVKAIEVNAELDIKNSGKGTYFSARNEALRAAEQQVINKYRDQKIDLKNIDEAATEKNSPVWKARHSVKFDMNSVKIALKGGNRVNSVFGVFDFYSMVMDVRKSQYEYAPYYMQDEGGVFTIGYSKAGWFSKTKYHKTYQSGPSKGNKLYIDKEEYNFWKGEGEALWGYLDAWGYFVPGLFNPVLPGAEIVI